MNLRIIARNGTVNSVNATIGDLVFDKRSHQLYLEVSTAQKTFKLGLTPLDHELIQPPTQEVP